MIEENGPFFIPFSNKTVKAVEGEILGHGKNLTTNSNNNNFCESKKSVGQEQPKKRAPPLDETWPNKIRKIVNKIAKITNLHEREENTRYDLLPSQKTVLWQNPSALSRTH